MQLWIWEKHLAIKLQLAFKKEKKLEKNFVFDLLVIKSESL